MLFDLDGVLFDARPIHRQALREALDRFGLLLSDEQEQELEGLPTKRKLELLEIPEDLREPINLEKQKRTLWLIHTQAQPLPNIVDLLVRLKMEGKRTAICSNAVRATVFAVMWRTGIAKYIDLVLSNEEARRPKPDPCVYEMALSCFHIKPREAVAIEDHPRGVAAATGAGIRCVQVNDPSEVSYGRLLSTS